MINVRRVLELPLDQMPELNPTVKVASLEVVKDVERMLSTTPSLGMIEFTPIMYGWEVRSTSSHSLEVCSSTKS